MGGPGPGRAVPPLDRGENVEKLWVMEFLGFTEMFSINVSFLNMNHVIQGWEAKVSKGGGAGQRRASHVFFLAPPICNYF